LPAKRPSSASARATSATPETAGRLLAAVRRHRGRRAATDVLLRQQEQRLAELADALRHGEKHKAEFLSTMSHELRTPLNVVLGFASLIYDEAFGPLNKQQLEACGKVLESAERLAQLINDLLDAAKLDRGQLTFKVGAIDLGELAAFAIEHVQPLAKQKGLKVEADLPDGLPRVSADADRLAQVLGHLFENAVKFTPAGGSIGLRVLAEPGDRIAIVEVWDTGIGIPREAHARLFERFYQVDSSNTREYGGTGIGLALVKEFVERLGGEVAVESEVGKGSTFRLALPVASGSPVL
jgi:signal transduction histidine kinase